jgi:hypothetical protein
MKKDNEMRKVAVIIENENYLPQCLEGLKYLKANSLKAWTIGVDYCRYPQDAKSLEELLYFFHKSGVDVIVVASKGLNGLAIFCDAFLRREMNNMATTVVAAILTDDQRNYPNLMKMKTEEFPDTQVIFSDTNWRFIGPQSFLNACDFAISEELPEIKLFAKLPIKSKQLEEVLTDASRQD